MSGFFIVPTRRELVVTQDQFMLKRILTDRRVWLLCFILIAIVGLCRWGVSVQAGFGFVVNWGYWVTLLLVVLFVRALVAEQKAENARIIGGRFDVAVLVAAVLVVAVWSAHEKPGYKILADELTLSGTAMGMHYERKAACPSRATDVQGAFIVVERLLDKRPLLYPFVVATAHDVTGYRPSNAFYVNIVLAMVFLWLVYRLGAQLGGSPWSGVCAFLLFAGLPLIAQQATGGGFELLNLLLITVLVLTACRYLRAPSVPRLEALVFGGLLLGWTRYESLLFLAPVAVIALVGWLRSGRVIASYPLIVSPAFLTCPLLQYRMFSEVDGTWQMMSRGVSEPFGVQYLSTNLGHALAYFFDMTGTLTNSTIFAVLGLICLPFLGLWIVRILRKVVTETPENVAVALCGTGLFALGMIYMLYFWGTFDEPIISRLSLPVHLLMMIAVVVIGKHAFKARPAGWKALAVLITAGIVFQGLPVIARQAYRTTYIAGMKMEAREEFLTRLVDRNVLVFDKDSFFWILQKIPASPVRAMAQKVDALEFFMRNRAFQGIFVVQNFVVDERTGRLALDPEDDLGAAFELETVFEKRVRTLNFLRISRVVAVTLNDQRTVRPVPFVEPVAETRTEAELEKARVLFMENWIKQLP